MPRPVLSWSETSLLPLASRPELQLPECRARCQARGGLQEALAGGVDRPRVPRRVGLVQ